MSRINWLLLGCCLIFSGLVSAEEGPAPVLSDQPADSAQFLPLTKDEYAALEKELVPLSQCAHKSQVDSARFTGQVNGKKIAKKIVAAGRGADLLRDVGTLPDYMEPEATVPAASKSALVDQVSAALWGLPTYIALVEMSARRPPINQLRAKAIFAHYGAIAAGNCTPSETFIRLYEKANTK